MVPIFFEGQNSWVFHFVFKFSASIREAALLREVLKQMGTKVVSHIGAPIDPASLTKIGDRHAIIDYLREAVNDLDPDSALVLSSSPQASFHSPPILAIYKKQRTLNVHGGWHADARPNHPVS